MKLQTFNGGLNSLPRPQFIQVTEGQVYENIDIDAGSLVPVKQAKETDIVTLPYQYYYIAGKRWVDSITPRDYVEFQKVLYWTDRVSPPQRMNKDGVITGLGIDKPAKITTADITSFPGAISEARIEPRTENAGLPMEIQYYLLINEGATGYSNAFHFSVDTRDRVTTIAAETNNPQVFNVINSDTTDSKRVVVVSEVGSVTADSVGFKLFRQYKGEFYLVGIVTTELIDNVEDISANEKLNRDKFGHLKGVYSYVMTYYNSTDGIESAPSDVSPEFDVSKGGFLTLRNLSIPVDPQVTGKRLYRVGGNIGEFTLVVELGNSVTTFVDNLRDTEVVGSLLTTIDASPAPTGISFLREAYAMLFGALDTALRFTPIGEPEHWPESNFLQFDSPITGIAPVANGILVFTRYRTHIVTGTGPTTLSSYLLSSDQGCIANESIQMISTEAVWASTDGICASSGNRPTVLTKDKMGKIELDPVDSIVFDETYYVLERDGSMLALYKGIITRHTQNISSLATANDKLYGYKDGKMWELFKSDLPTTFKFTSARLTEGSFTTNKTYKKVFFYSTGHVIIKILINDVVVQTQVLTNKDSHQIQVPQELQRGFYIHFEIEGTGEVSEIEYEVGQ